MPKNPHPLSMSKAEKYRAKEAGDPEVVLKLLRLVTQGVSADQAYQSLEEATSNNRRREEDDDKIRMLEALMGVDGISSVVNPVDGKNTSVFGTVDLIVSFSNPEIEDVSVILKGSRFVIKRLKKRLMRRKIARDGVNQLIATNRVVFLSRKDDPQSMQSSFMRQVNRAEEAAERTPLFIL